MSTCPFTRLPNYGDDEVRVFHPLCEKALKQALIHLGLDNTYEVLHHEVVGTLQADYVLKNKTTKKYLLFIEVKRTPGAVSSTRYRNQGQAYVREANIMVEQPYYCLTNLEIIDLFKHDSSRPVVSQQLIDPSPIRVGNFQDPVTDFYDHLVKAFEQIISISVQDTGVYKLSTAKLLAILQSRRDNVTTWHQALVVAGYEYIRGVLKGQKVSVPVREAVNFRNRPAKLLQEGRKIDFNVLFSEPHPNSTDSDVWDVNLLSEMNELGEKALTGDELAELIHSIAIRGKGHEGIVPTDIELGKVLSILSQHVLGGELGEDEIICDPAAGSGNLLATVSTGFPNISPEQLWANDIEPLFLELLSIRLGLLFPRVISPRNAPIITGRDICDIDRDECHNVKVVVLNPPYLSGVSNPGMKRKFAAKIEQISGEEPKTNVGQIGVEALFLELVTELVSDGTVVSAIMPKQYLTSRGNEAKAFRNFLLGTFGLQHIFLYPRQGLFEEVTKDTVVFVGKKNSAIQDIEVFHSFISLEEIELHSLKQRLNQVQTSEDSSISLGMGLELNKIKKQQLAARVENGWRNITKSGELAEEWITNNLEGTCTRLCDTEYLLRRGKVGNKGASDLVFINSNKSFWSIVQELVPTSWLYPALRKVNEIEEPIINLTSTPTKVMCPPPETFEENTRESEVLDEIVEKYIEFQVYKSKQKKAVKTKEDLISILKFEANNGTIVNTILIPRALRRKARAFINEQEVFCSTNVIEVIGGEEEEKWLLLSWLLSIFSQMQFEAMAKDQEGARKLEKDNSIENLYIPDFTSIPTARKQELIHEAQNVDFFDLVAPTIRKVDELWAQTLWPEEESLKTAEAVDLLEELVYERYPVSR
ncbi:BpuSI family type II restriction endonuclease [Evansella sp. AB-rgal1]|uniref:BpuSI family type II restriction endonuclease n=1 Tax=Evansella sp. AB-rgal1 TaxID=3242696 RepID=UPI00359EA360